MTPTCDQVTERLALGEPLGELAEHAASCERCQGVVKLSSQLGATRHAVDPGLGFSARMTAGAQHRLVARRRQRLTAGLAATVACGAFGVFLVTRSPVEPPQPSTFHGPQPTAKDDGPKLSPEPSDDELIGLVRLADVDRSSRLSARWGHIKRPLKAYKKLLDEVTP